MTKPNGNYDHLCIHHFSLTLPPPQPRTQTRTHTHTHTRSHTAMQSGTSTPLRTLSAPMCYIMVLFDFRVHLHFYVCCNHQYARARSRMCRSAHRAHVVRRRHAADAAACRRIRILDALQTKPKLVRSPHAHTHPHIMLCRCDCITTGLATPYFTSPHAVPVASRRTVGRVRVSVCVCVFECDCARAFVTVHTPVRVRLCSLAYQSEL